MARRGATCVARKPDAPLKVCLASSKTADKKAGSRKAERSGRRRRIQAIGGQAVWAELPAISHTAKVRTFMSRIPLAAFSVFTLAAALLSACNTGSTVPPDFGNPRQSSATLPKAAHVDPASKLGTFKLFFALPANDDAVNLITGPDSNFYYPAENYASETPVIVQFQSNGMYQTFPIPQPTGVMNEPALNMTNGPDNRIWFGTFLCTIDAMTTGGSFQEYVVSKKLYEGCTVRVGSYVGQNIWFTLEDNETGENNAVGYITTGGAVTLFRIRPEQPTSLGEITLGPDGNMWFAYSLPGSTNGDLVRVTPAGKIKLFPIDPPQFVDDVITGPDGDLWFCSQGEAYVGRMSTSGKTLTETNVPGTTYQMTVGSDDNVWVTSVVASGGGPHLLRFTSATKYEALNIPNDSHMIPSGITTGPDKNMWFDQYSSVNGEGQGMGTFIFSKPPKKR
jgi:streptogramin lyase